MTFSGSSPLGNTSSGGERCSRIQSMLGYSIHPPFMGHVNGLHPLRLLDPHYDSAEAGAGKAAADYWSEGDR